MKTPDPHTTFFVNKWHTFAACAVFQLSSGLSYTFPIYSDEFKRSFDWNQTQLEGFSCALNLGAFGAFIPGLLYSRLEAHGRVAPRVTLACAVVMATVGMGLIYAALEGYVTLTYAQLLVAAFLFTNSNAFMDITAVTCNVINWPNDRGMAVGVMKAAVGLSGGVYTTVYVTLLQPSVRAFLLFTLIACPLSVLISIPWVNQVPWVQRCEAIPYGLLTSTARFVMAYQVLLLMAAFNIGVAVVMQHDPPAVVRYTAVVALLILVSSLWLTTAASGGVRSRPAHLYLDPDLSDDVGDRRPPASVLSHPLRLEDLFTLLRAAPSAGARDAQGSMDRVYTVDSSTSSHHDLTNEPSQGDALTSPLLALTESEASLPLVGAVSIGSVASMRSQTSIASELYHEQVALDVHPLRMLCTSEFHCLLACTFVAMGTGLGIVNNLPQLIQSLSPGGVALPDLKDNLLILFFVCNMSGRILAGYVPERCLHLYGTARPEFLFITAATTLAWTLAAAGATLAAGNPWATRALYPIILALGLSFGASWTLMATIVSEVFGLRYFATNYALVQLASMAASFVFPSAVVARLYDRAAAAQHPPGAHGDLSCTGTPCFLWAFLAMAALAVLQVVAAWILWARTLWVYERMAEHLREVDEVIVEEGSEA